MASTVIMPKLGMTMETGVLTKWYKKEGDPVSKGDILFDLETDKLSNSVEAEADGVLRKILVGEGEEVPILTEVAVIAAADEDISALTGEAPAAEAPAEAAAAAPAAAPTAAPAARGGRIFASPRARKLAKERGIDLALIAPTGPNGRIVEKDVKNYTPAAAPEAAPVPAAAPVKASPMAAKAAAQLGVDLADLHVEGRVMMADVLKAVQQPAQAPAAAPAAAAHTDERVRMSGMRKAIAKNMHNSVMTSPTVTYNMSVDMTEAKKFREQLKSAGIKVSYTDIIIKFVAKALLEFPIVNCTIDGDEMIYRNYVNMGVAVALDNGLIVPTIFDADKLSISEISAELKSLADAAKNGSLSMDKLTGGTFTISNLGMFGMETFSPIINQPQVAILGVNKMEDKVVVRDGEMVIRPIMALSLTADHRAVDGAVAAQFEQRVKQLLENPALMLA